MSTLFMLFVVFVVSLFFATCIRIQHAMFPAKKTTVPKGQCKQILWVQAPVVRHSFHVGGNLYQFPKAS